MTNAIPSPIPIQAELIPVGDDCLLLEYRATFRNEEAHMPEVPLRYLLWLILSGQPEEEIRRFANQVRLDLNEQRLSRSLNPWGITPVMLPALGTGAKHPVRGSASVGRES